MQEDIRLKIRDDLSKGLRPTDIFDSLTLQGHDSDEVRKAIMDIYERKVDSNPWNFNVRKNKEEPPIQNKYIVKPEFIKEKKERKKLFSNIHIKHPKRVLIFLVIIILLSVGVYILNSIEFEINFTKNPYKVPKDSFYGQINFSDKIDNTLLNDVIPQAKFTLKKSTYENLSTKGYFFNYTFKNPTTREEGKIDIEVRDYVSSKFSDKEFNKIYRDYKLNNLGLINVPTIAPNYDKADYYKVIFDLHVEQLDDKGYKVMYVVSEENFLIITNAYFSMNEPKEEKNKISYFAGNRVRKYIHDISR